LNQPLSSLEQIKDIDVNFKFNSTIEFKSDSDEGIYI
jgi:hypothetical protein